MFSTIENYYEHLVFNRIKELLVQPGNAIDRDHLDDIACVALNRLPHRYVRNSVDLAFHMTDEEWTGLTRQIDEAVDYAIEFARRRTEERSSGEYT